MSDICERLVRFNQHKECVSTDLEVEAADEITRLREELAAAQSRITDLTKISATLNVRTSKLNALREENARVRKALEEALPFVRIKGMWSEEIHDRIAAAIREGGKDEN